MNKQEYICIMLDGCKRGTVLRYREFPPLEIYFPIIPKPNFKMFLEQKRNFEKKIVYKLVGVNKEYRYALYKEKKPKEERDEQA